jgi:flagellin
MVINTNMAAQQTASRLAQSAALLAQSLARLSSGSKIVSPQDDPAGQAVVTRLDARIHRLNAAGTCVGNAISYCQTQDGYLQQVSRSADRLGELALLALDPTKTNADRALYDTEFQSLGAYLHNVSSQQFNGLILFQPDFSGAVATTLSVPTDSEGGSFSMSTKFNESALNSLICGGMDLTSSANAANALDYAKNASRDISGVRAQVGANLTRLNYTREQLSMLGDNLTAATSRIKDVDVADESTRYARYNILVQAGTAMLAQANLAPQSVLQLLE